MQLYFGSKQDSYSYIYIANEKSCSNLSNNIDVIHSTSSAQARECSLWPRRQPVYNVKRYYSTLDVLPGCRSTFSKSLMMVMQSSVTSKKFTFFQRKRLCCYMLNCEVCRSSAILTCCRRARRENRCRYMKTCY